MADFPTRLALFLTRVSCSIPLVLLKASPAMTTTITLTDFSTGLALVVIAVLCGDPLMLSETGPTMSVIAHTTIKVMNMLNVII